MSSMYYNLTLSLVRCFYYWVVCDVLIR